MRYFFIFAAAGSIFDKKDKSPRWDDELEKVNKPFAVQCHNEIDDGIMPYRDKFFNHKKL